MSPSGETPSLRCHVTWSNRLVVCSLFTLVALGASTNTAWPQTATVSVYGEVTDQQRQVVPSATVTIAHVDTGTFNTTATDERGVYKFVGLWPGTYTIKVERTGFKTTIAANVPLLVETTTRQNLLLEVGGIAETVNVVAESAQINTTDASLGNAFSRNQIRNLPIEAQNVVQLLSLQPGAVFIPKMPSQAGGDEEDPRYGSVNGARADQQSVTLDGVDVNDPQNQTGYTSSVRLTQEALQEFRVSTANHNADMGRSSGPQVVLVTRGGTNQFDGSAYWTFRRTKTSSNEYFLKLSQLGSGQPSTAPKLNKDIVGGSVGGPIQSNRLFFFLNIENLREQSETPLIRAVPSNSFRDGVLMYQCASAAACPGGSVRGFNGTHAVPSGWYGMAPAEIAALDPLRIGPSMAGAEYFRQYPAPNDPGRDTNNIAAYRFAAPIKATFYTLLTRVDYNLTASGSHRLFGRFGNQHDTIDDPPQFPGQGPRRRRLLNNHGLALGSDAVLSSTLTNSFRYGVTKIDEANEGVTKSNHVTFRFIDPFDGVGVTGVAGTFTDAREPNTHNVVDDLSWFRNAHHVKLGANLRFTRIPKERFQNSFLSASVNPSWVAGVGRRNMPGGAFCAVPVCATLPAVAAAGEAGYADAWLNSLGVLSHSVQRANYDRQGNPQAPGTPVARTLGSDEYEVYLQDSWQIRPNLTITGGLRYSVYAPPYEVNGLQVAPAISMGDWFDQRMRNMQQGIPSNRSPIVTFDLAGPANDRKGFYAWDKNNVAPRIAAAWSPAAERGFLRWLTGDGDLVVRGGYAKVFDRVGLGLATNFDEGFAFGMSTVIDSPFGALYEEDDALRFRGPTTLPPTVPAAPAGGFPQTPPRRAGIITESIDDTLVTPSAHMASAVIGRQLGPNVAFEAAYVGRLGRDQLVRRDLAMPLNLVDPRSGMSYFAAAQATINAAQANGITSGSPATAFAALPTIAYWENLFPGAAGGGLTATQAVARAFMLNGPDWITALYEMDTACRPACSIFGPYAYFAEQVRLACRHQLRRPIKLPRDAADAAEGVCRRAAVRH